MVRKQLNFNLNNYEGIYDKFIELEETTGLKRIKLFEAIVNEYYSKRTFSNDFIELPASIYISYDAIVNPSKYEGLKVASTDLEYITGNTDIDNILMLSKIPNNLDSWNAVYNTYCYGNESYTLHKGVIAYYT